MFHSYSYTLAYIDRLDVIQVSSNIKNLKRHLKMVRTEAAFKVYGWFCAFTCISLG